MMAWDALSDEQLEAALCIGYTSDDWPGGASEGSTTSEATTMAEATATAADAVSNCIPLYYFCPWFIINNAEQFPSS